MSNIRLFFSESLSLNLTAKLDKSQSHYINKVMRIKVNETFSLFNTSGEWEAKIKEVSKGMVEFNIIKQLRQKKNNKEIWLAFSPINSNYFSFMIQKATELGITKFIPLITDRTIVRKINYERIKKIIIESSEQSNRISVPDINKLENLQIFLNNFPKEGNLIFCDINSKTSNLKNILSKNIKRPICILIGPEGDFSENERQSIIDMDRSFPLSLSSNILRVETAAIAAISIVNFHLEKS